MATTSIILSSLDGDNGFRVDGTAAGDSSGASVSSAGDVNGDGFDDVIIGASGADPNGDRSGSSYVVFGKAAGFGAAMDLSSLDGSNGFRLNGVGGSVSGAGDVNGDGFDDVIVDGSYVVFGRTSSFDAAMDLSSLDGSNGFRLNGAGGSVSGAGDVNGDGFDDVIIGGSKGYTTYPSQAIVGYLVFGKASGFSASMDLSGLDGGNGFHLSIEAYGAGAMSVSSAGDINGDGFDDLVISILRRTDTYSHDISESYVVFGKASSFDATLDLSSLDGSDGFSVIRADTGDYGNLLVVSDAGDVNGDGFDDLIVGSPAGGSNYAGVSYVVFGRASGFAATLNLTDLDGSNGFRVDGVAEFDSSGASVSSAGDVNGDGFDDVIVGTLGADPYDISDAGVSYIMFGKASGFGATMDLSNLDSNGIRLDGVSALDRSGSSVSSAGDVNSDGFDDLIVGAPGADTNGSRSGASYVLFGSSNFTGTGTFLGTPGDDTLTGTAAIERFKAGDGNDTMTGGGGADLFQGDAGDDIIRVPDSGFLSVDGGTGNDTLELTGSGINLNLANFRGDSRFNNDNTIRGVETIDLTGSGDNTLAVTEQDLLDLSDTSDALVVKGNAGDHVAGLSQGWVDGGIQGNFHAFTKHGATLLIDSSVSTDPLTPSVINLSNLNGSNGFRLDGAGGSVSGAGDVNGDGFDDVIIGVYGDDPNGNYSGSSYVVFGTASGFDATLDLTNLDGSNGFRLDGAGWSVSSAGDVNGDGFADVIIGAVSADPNGNSSGSSYVVFGTASSFDAAMDLSTLDGSNGFRADGVAMYDYSGRSVSSAGDVNGDGFDDLIIGADEADPNGVQSGSSYVVFGKAAGFAATMDLSSLDGGNGFRLDGGVEKDYAGLAVSNAGDVNGDGFDDVIVGARSVEYSIIFSGSSYVVFGKASGFDAALDLSSLDGSNGFRLIKSVRDYSGGSSVSNAGDVNGDGFDDLIVGSSRYSDNSSSSHVVFGKASGFSATLDLSSLDGSNGVRLDWADSMGQVSGAGDVNGDGFDDLIVGVSETDPNGERSGSSYVLFGSSSLSDIVTYVGTSGDDTLTGTTAAERFQAGDGNDTMISGGGADVFQGGTGDDVIRVPDFGFLSMDGGAGNDTLELTGSGIDLSLANFIDIIGGIETIDMTGSGDNTLTLTAQDVFDLSDISDALIVKGNAGDRVVGLSQGWADGGMQGNFNVYTQRGAVLLVDAAVSTDPLSPGVISLSNLNGNNGFRVDGVAEYDSSGSSVSSAGDVNGDGFADIIIGAAGADPNGNYSGSSYVVFGTATGFDATLDLSSLDGSNGFRVDGVAESDGSGISVSSAGDVNGDGFDDLIIGAAVNDPNDDYSVFYGASYVVFGKASGFSATVNLSSLDGNTGFRLDGTVIGSPSSSFVVSKAGDVNGDGFADVIIGSSRAGPGGDYSGASYVVFGRESGFDAALDLSSLDGSNGFRLDGAEREDRSGWSVSNAGDVNGDGFADVIIGALGAGPNGDNSGFSYVVFGKAAGFAAAMDLSSLDGNNGFRLDGGAEKDYAGLAVSSAGDVNGDGFADVIIGALGADPNGNFSGSSYVVFGKASGFSAATDLSSLDGSNGFRVDGEMERDRSGESVSSAGDVNGDGFDDVIIGSNRYSGYLGSAYVVFGKTSGFGATLSLASLDGSNGVRLDGADSMGQVSGAGDVNGDGFDDLIVGAPGADPNGDYSGSSYVIFGRSDFGGGGGGELPEILGTPGDDVLRGTPVAELFEAGDGNDRMIGRGGADVFHGDAGDDYIQVADLGFASVDGGSGNDTLHTDGKDLNLDLSLFGDKIHGIETICLYGRGDNELTLTAEGLLNLSDTDNTLRVNGNAGDHITVLDDGWVDEGNRGSGYYHVYTNDDAVLLVGMNVTVDFA